MSYRAALTLLFVAAAISSAVSLKVKLVGGSSEKEGNVYVQDAQTGEWGLICDDGWSYRAGKIVCQMLGYHITRITTNDAYGASPTDKIFMDDVRCTGQETDISQCPQSRWHRHNCEVNEAAGVECTSASSQQPTRSDSRFRQFPVGFRPPQLTPESRLRNDYNYIDWWNWANHARGLDSRNQYPPGIRYPSPGATPAPPPQLPGRRPSATQRPAATQHPAPATTRRTIRPTTTTTQRPSTRRRTRPPTTTTQRPTTRRRTEPPTTTQRPTTRRAATTRIPVTPTIASISLAGGRNVDEGYVSVTLSDGSSGTICSDGWSMAESRIVCQQLGLGYAQRAITTDFFAASTMTKVVQRVDCTGNEERLEDCTVKVARGSCSRATSVAGVICTTGANAATTTTTTTKRPAVGNRQLPDLVANITAIEQTIMIQDMRMAYLECSMEENCLSSSAYELKRTQPRNYASMSRRLLRFSSTVYNQGTADFRPVQHRSTWEWHQCHNHYHSMDVFTHYDIISMTTGEKVAEGHKASFCLEDVFCENKPKKYQCRGGGEQGISVGCADIYAYTIDCQWIDITDMETGEYLFKLKVNPDELVEELDFDNNVITCTLNYTGYNVSVRNCQLGRH